MTRAAELFGHSSRSCTETFGGIKVATHFHGGMTASAEEELLAVPETIQSIRGRIRPTDPR
ncbi:hypothetical protein MUK42_13478 [Musa troglodytarum]|uniref:Uncharacterized protein n=1 Tax=Musa troglodytarum TaxID=320322 RepID=A0A9E7I405_9LILI|nr:hypothetical protein MUK42_13478 [Musa troglodytarum]